MTSACICAVPAHALQPQAFEEERPQDETMLVPPAYVEDAQSAPAGRASAPSAEERRQGVLRRAGESLGTLDALLQPEEPGKKQGAGDGAGGSGGGAGSAGEGDGGGGDAYGEGLYGEDDAAGGSTGEGLPGEEALAGEGNETVAGEDCKDCPRQAEGAAAPTDRSTARGAGGTYSKDDDLVTRQICELAQQEPDPQVRESLEKKCRELRAN